GALGSETQAIVAGLLQFGSGERRRSKTALFFLRHAGNLPERILYRSQNPLGPRFVRHFDVFALVLNQLGFKGRRFARAEKGMDGPILFGEERADFLLALNDQSKRDGLDAACGKTSAHFVPQERRNFVTNDAVE